MMEGKCARCDSAKLIPDVPLHEHYGEHGTKCQLFLEVHAKPQAWIFKEPMFGKLSALVCGECGFVELRVSNPKVLYEAYQRSLQG